MWTVGDGIWTTNPFITNSHTVPLAMPQPLITKRENRHNLPSITSKFVLFCYHLSRLCWSRRVTAATEFKEMDLERHVDETSKSIRVTTSACVSNSSLWAPVVSLSPVRHVHIFIFISLMCRCSNSVPFDYSPPPPFHPIHSFSAPFCCPPTPIPPFLSILTPLAGLLLAIAWRAPPILSTPLHPGVLSHDVEPHPGPVLRHHYPFSGARAVCLLHRRCVVLSLILSRTGHVFFFFLTQSHHMTPSVSCKCVALCVSVCLCLRNVIIHQMWQTLHVIHCEHLRRYAEVNCWSGCYKYLKNALSRSVCLLFF